MKHALHELRESTRPPDAAIARVRARLHEPARVVRALRGQTPPRAALARVRGRLAVRRRQIVVPALLAAALVLATVLVARSGPAEVRAMLDSPAAWSEDHPTSGLSLLYMGSGTLQGNTRDLRVNWRVGTLALSLDPSAKTRLVVVTPEGRATVRGTRFRVTRDPTGTRVAVDEGRVSVACTGRSEVAVSTGGALDCLPRTSAGLLARSRALRDDPERALAAADAGLSEVGDDDAVRGELQAARIDALLALDRKDEALAESRRYLRGNAAPRAQEIERVAAVLSLELEGCRGALPHLLALTEPDEHERAWLAHCGRAGR